MLAGFQEHLRNRSRLYVAALIGLGTFSVFYPMMHLFPLPDELTVKINISLFVSAFFATLIAYYFHPQMGLKGSSGWFKAAFTYTGIMIVARGLSSAFLMMIFNQESTFFEQIAVIPLGALSSANMLIRGLMSGFIAWPVSFLIIKLIATHLSREK